MNQPLPELQQAKVLPMVGDDVLFHINGARIYSPCPEQLNADQPMAAKVVYVWGPEMVNLQVIDHQGNPRAVTSVRFMQPDDEDTPCGAYCTLPVIECEPGQLIDWDFGTDVRPAQEPEPERVLSFGERAVGLSFNPGGNEAVNKCKAGYASLIDQLEARRQSATDGEVKRLCSVAITEAQTAQMWAVKALTWAS